MCRNRLFGCSAPSGQWALRAVAYPGRRFALPWAKMFKPVGLKTQERKTGRAEEPAIQWVPRQSLETNLTKPREAIRQSQDTYVHQGDPRLSTAGNRA